MNGSTRASLKDALTKLTTAAEYCKTLESDESLDATFRKAGVWIDQAHQILLGAENEDEMKNMETDIKSLKENLRKSRDRANALADIFIEVGHAEKASRQETYRQECDESLEDVLKELLMAIKTLVDAKLIPATDDQRTKLDASIDELSNLGVGTSANKGGGTSVTHGGRGDMFNNLGNGKQYNHRGSGNQTNADTINYHNPVGAKPN